MAACSAAAFAAGAVVEGQIAGSPDELSSQLDTVEQQLQNHLKELKTFIGGMNSMCGAALSIADQFKQNQKDPFTDKVRAFATATVARRASAHAPACACA